MNKLSKAEYYRECLKNITTCEELDGNISFSIFLNSEYFPISSVSDSDYCIYDYSADDALHNAYTSYVNN